MLAEQLEFGLFEDDDLIGRRLSLVEDRHERTKRALFGRIGDIGKFCLEVKAEQDELVDRLYLVERRLMEAGL